ncbi:NADH:flavin oxidoreductase/NADH oxidase [Aquibacillus salsiterrae]|uniref:NADH:flavin oxidoreductase/NADH oxidase n=1 Tax=Aquibacillus salsiterrae TaxID=2950439 RepID=A0A9X3WGZ8_9BACI|nr:NADH:flavin oxidoreductase/NADH oxidase [Aquibacillus salsiterrae]MDC3418230.1 NADH:flavin oxidoreductase/NADH oxidase [Aquibacillus salsiterrae]
MDMMTPFSYKGLALKNRVVMPPMCQFKATAEDGIPNEWHYVHYVSRAVGGAGLIIFEMTNVEPDGRITDRCLGLWSDKHTEAFRKIITQCKQYGAKTCIQIAHAGRKAEDAEVPVAPSAIPYSESSKVPHELTKAEIKRLIGEFQAATKRAVDAGVDAIELHGAHGYLHHQFLSPHLNQRQDEYGEDRALFGVEVIEAMKAVMPVEMPLIMRVSANEYVDGGYDLAYLVEMCTRFKVAGVDMFHVSSGGEGPLLTQFSSEPGYQVPYADEIRTQLGVPVIAVGKLDDPHLANQVLAQGKADLVAVGRGMLDDPYWAHHAAIKLGQEYQAPGVYQEHLK